MCFCISLSEESEQEVVGVLFTKEQKEMIGELKALYSADDISTVIRKRQLLKTSVRFIMQDVWMVERLMLVQFAGVLGYRKETGQWRGPEHYTYILAGILWYI